VTPRLKSELAVRLISQLRLYSSFAPSTSPSSNFAVPCSRQRRASDSAGSEAEDCAVTEEAQPKRK